MTQRLYVRKGGGSSTAVEVTDMVLPRKGAPIFTDGQSSIQMGRKAADGESAQGKFLLVDPEAEIHSTTYRLSPHALVTWTEDASGDELWLARGRIAPLESGRRSTANGPADEVEWEVLVNDNNMDLRGQAFTEDWVRPRETDLARIHALRNYTLNGSSSTAPHSRTSCNPVIDHDVNGHLVSTAFDRIMPARTYPAGTQPRDVIAECAERSGKTFALVIHHTGGSSHDCLLYIGALDHSTYVTDVKISDQIADWDVDNVTEPVFPPIWDMGKGTTTDNDDVVSGVVVIYGGTNDNPQSTFVHDPADENPYEYWVESINDDRVDTQDEAENLAQTYFTSHRAPGHRTHQFSIRMKASQHHLIAAGMSIQVKSAVIAGGPTLGTYVWRRITELQWEPTPDPEYLWAHIHLEKVLRRRGLGAQPIATTPHPPSPPTPPSTGVIGAACDGGTTGILVSGEASGEFDWHACDLNDTSSWGTNGFPVSAQWWARDYGELVTANAVRIFNSENAANSASSVNMWGTNSSSLWTALGSASPGYDFSAAGWTLVDVMAGLSAGDNGILEMAEGSFQYWAWDAVTGGGNGWTAYELTLYFEDGGTSGDTPPPASDDDTGSIGDTGSGCYATCDHQHPLPDLTAHQHAEYLTNTLGAKEVLSVVADAGSAIELNLADGNAFDLTLTDDCDVSITGATVSRLCWVTIIARQDGTGGHCVNLGSEFSMLDGSDELAIDQTADHVSVIKAFTVNGGTDWFTHVEASGTGSGGYTDEEAQDAIGAMIADTSTVNLTYTDATPELKADVIQSGLDHGSIGGLSDDDHPQYIKDSEFAAKGDLLVGTGSGTFDNLPVGSNGQIPVADSGETTGIRWASPGAASVALYDSWLNRANTTTAAGFTFSNVTRQSTGGPDGNAYIQGSDTSGADYDVLTITGLTAGSLILVTCWAKSFSGGGTFAWIRSSLPRYNLATGEPTTSGAFSGTQLPGSWVELGFTMVVNDAGTLTISMRYNAGIGDLRIRQLAV